MAFGRRKTPVTDPATSQESRDQSAGDYANASSASVSRTESVSLGKRSKGPWDLAERQPAEGEAYIDLGALLVRGRVGQQIRLQSEEGAENIGAALIIGDQEALELRAFAGPKTGGQWSDVLADILDEVTRMEGSAKEVEGPYGTEAHISIPVKLDDGQAATQPSRILGIEGPRWLLRATLLGHAATEPSDYGDLMETLRDTIVVRGEAPMMAREPLLLTPPPEAVMLDTSDAESGEPVDDRDGGSTASRTSSDR